MCFVLVGRVRLPDWTSFGNVCYLPVQGAMPGTTLEVVPMEASS